MNFRSLLNLLLLFFVIGTHATFTTFILDKSGNFTVSWEISGDEITFILKINEYSWMAIGFHPSASIDGGMINADIISAEWNTTTNSPEVNDRFSQTEDYPHLDTENGCPNNILNGSVSGSQINGITTIQFKRKLDTGDAECDSVISGTESQRIIWAHGNYTQGFDYHYNFRGSYVLQLGPYMTTGTVQSVQSNSLSSNSIIALTIGIVVLVLGVLNLGYACYVWKQNRHNKGYSSINEE